MRRFVWSHVRMRQQHPLGLDPDHPLFPVAAMRHEPATGAVEIRFTDGRSEHGTIAALGAPTWIRDMTFDARTSTLQVTLHSGVELTMSIGTVRTPVDRPVGYLDQNHWIDMARFGIGSPRLSDERRRTCRRITDSRCTTRSCSRSPQRIWWRSRRKPTGNAPRSRRS
jgi:hypothetical protein